eukprot:gb/GECH01002350.1/.p1 GENE.gb/GECH01002350.1/~~gb/GECH01002350.1/.p1  ORF type:complete len:263 (+),score=40.07 gb/GECH01002350.1/:1-789(+)
MRMNYWRFRKLTLYRKEYNYLHMIIILAIWETPSFVVAHSLSTGEIVSIILGAIFAAAILCLSVLVLFIVLFRRLLVHRNTPQPSQHPLLHSVLHPQVTYRRYKTHYHPVEYSKKKSFESQNHVNPNYYPRENNYQYLNDFGSGSSGSGSGGNPPYNENHLMIYGGDIWSYGSRTIRETQRPIHNKGDRYHPPHVRETAATSIICDEGTNTAPLSSMGTASLLPTPHTVNHNESSLHMETFQEHGDVYVSYPSVSYPSSSSQ